VWSVLGRVSIFLQPCSVDFVLLCMYFCSRVLRSVPHVLCIFAAMSCGVCFVLCSFLQQCPVVCASFRPHFYNRVLWFVIRFVCIFTAVSNG
jgi:hypothetical protein